MNATDLTFGCEIECYLPAGVIPASQVGGYHAGRQVAGLPAGWNAQRDGSLSDAPAGYTAVEIVSPVLRGVEGLAQVVAVCAWLNANHARITKKCGFHVHVGVANDRELLRKIACLAAKHEKALYAAAGNRDRERSHYCATVQGDEDLRRAIEAGQLDGHGAAGARYRVLNMQNVLRGGRQTVEFRVFSGTTNALKAVTFIRMALAVVERAHAMKRLPKWTAAKAKTTSNLHHAGGEGQSEMLRWFYYAGWTLGKSPRTYGNLVADGLPTLDESKKELMRLAAKYDSRAD